RKAADTGLITGSNELRVELHGLIVLSESAAIAPHLRKGDTPVQVADCVPRLHLAGVSKTSHGLCRTVVFQQCQAEVVMNVRNVLAERQRSPQVSLRLLKAAHVEAERA